MNKVLANLLLVALMAVGVARAQAPTGTLVGVVSDPTGAPVVGAHIRISHRDSGLTRTLITSTAGDYSAAALPSGIYQVSADAAGFSRLERAAAVEVGTTTVMNFTFQVGGVSEAITVSSTAPLLHYEHHQVGGLVTRAQIDSLPLNGRNFLDLARLEPGVTNSIKATNNRLLVPILGAGLSSSPRIGYTRVTVDGGDINFIATIGAALQVSQEVVQEFQIATTNFDLSTGVTSDGAINIVTRAGGKQYHGGGFYFYRDHRMSAYPGLARDPSNPDPFFQRRQFGFHLGGPIYQDRAFFFASSERNDQRGVLSIQPRPPEFASLGGIFPSPYLGDQFSLRFDGRLSANHNAFCRRRWASPGWRLTTGRR